MAEECAMTSPEGFIVYEIQRGDTLTKIASRKFLDAIKRTNRIDEKHLAIGKKILIPKNLEAGQ